ncbi:hypothetical protein NPIL_135711, partial [Nephila pilipes]
LISENPLWAVFHSSLLLVLPFCSFLFAADPLTQAPAKSLYWDLVLSFVGWNLSLLAINYQDSVFFRDPVSGKFRDCVCGRRYSLPGSRVLF